MADCKRKLSYVDKRVQGALARRLILHWSAFLAVGTLFSLVFQWLHNPFHPSFQGFQALATQTWNTNGPFLLTGLLLMPVFVFDAIRLSARFAGPIFRLRRTFQAIAADGRPREIAFRSHDFWRDMANDFNKMVNRLFERDTIAERVDDDWIDADTQLESVR